MASINEKDKIQKEKKRNIEILRSYTIDLSDEDEDEEVVVQEVSSKRNVSKKKKFVGASNVREKLKMNAWDKIATWAYSVGLPLNAVRDEGFQDMINSIGEYGRGMPAPSYHNIHVTLMKKHLKDTQKFVDSFRPHWEEYRCSIMSEFWIDGKGRCLINFLVNCPLGTVFLRSIDASEHVKNAQLIMEMINEVIKDVGEKNIVQFITDNGSNFKAAGKILEEQHPKLFWTPCAAHCVNIMIGDIAIMVYIYNHERILNLMRKLTKNKELHRSCATRFATQFYRIQSIHENRHHIQVLFVSEEWKKSDFAKKLAGKKVERIVAKQEFWDNVHFTCQVLAPLVDVVRLVDTEENPCMGYIYNAVDRAKEMITRLWAMIQARWRDQLHHSLHAVPDNDDNDKLRQDLNLYIDSVGQFGSPAAIRARAKVAPYIWWRTYGIGTPLVQNLAITVLSQTCSASPCERYWSAFDNLHSKKRNCLLQQKLNDLVFIQYNTRLQRRYNSLKSNRSLDPILLRDVEENDDWVIPTKVELQEFVDGRDVGVTTRSKRERYRDDVDDDIRIEVNDPDEQLDALVDVDSEEDLMAYD
uniref:DUF659 domain-containing protein n=1 Tax=Lactuca sativa TaxID=4236 RepID=A0A9R1V8N6_LACSA|nr:hypothetical protein LSAT_V11C600321310 [Lactuca sativa]